MPLSTHQMLRLRNFSYPDGCHSTKYILFSLSTCEITTKHFYFVNGKNQDERFIYCKVTFKILFSDVLLTYTTPFLSTATPYGPK